jgi:hypothetical protein
MHENALAGDVNIIFIGTVGRGTMDSLQSEKLLERSGVGRTLFFADRRAG